MAHVGKYFPYSKGRDLLINDDDQGWGPPKVFRWYDNGTATGSLGGGWGQHRNSEPGVVDYPNGKIVWRWQPPTGANPLTAFEVELYIATLMVYPYQQSLYNVYALYNGVRGPRFVMTYSTTASGINFYTPGSPFIIVSGVGTLSWTVGTIVSASWAQI